MDNINYYKSNKISKKDLYFAILIAFMFFHNSLLNYFSELIEKIAGISNFQTFFYPFVYFSLFILSYKPDRFKWIRTTDFLIAMFFGVSLLITYVVFPSNWIFIVDQLYTDILPCIPFFVLGLCLNLDNETYKIINTINLITIIVNIIYIIYFINSGRDLVGSHGEDYSMYKAYMILPNILMAIEYSFRTKKTVPFIITIVGFIYILSMGTRGPIIIVITFFIIYSWLYSKIKRSYKIFLSIIIILLIYMFSSTSIYMDFLLDVKDALFNSGVSTRVIDYLINGEIISNTTGRNDIYSVLINKLNASPLIGYGILGEYAIGFRAGAHNVYLQILFDFGYPIGICLMIAYIRIVYRAFVISNNTTMQRWIIMFGCMVFVKGIFSSSFLNYNVFFLLGLSLKMIRCERYKSCLKQKNMENIAI